jgi:hypothetical protein
MIIELINDRLSYEYSYDELDMEDRIYIIEDMLNMVKNNTPIQVITQVRKHYNI